MIIVTIFVVGSICTAILMLHAFYSSEEEQEQIRYETKEKRGSQK